MYFKLNKNARWSDGKPVTAHDFAYTLEFMRSKYIVAPWYNDFYTEFIDKVIVYDDYTLSVNATRPLVDLYLYLTISPIPRHYYKKLDKDFVIKYNWEIIPNTGPYQINDFKKGKYITFKRKKDWWAKDLKYFKNRFNVDKVKFLVIKEQDIT
jgi:microcin C transport system substrate-binding protein